MGSGSSRVHRLIAAGCLALSLGAGSGVTAAERGKGGEAFTARRDLTPAQQAAMAKTLAQYAPMRVDIFTFGDIAEITGFGDKLAATLKAAGWSPKVWLLDNGIAYGVVGVPVFARGASGPKADAATAALMQALRDQKVASQKFEPFKNDEPIEERFAATWNTSDVGGVRVYVGLAPP
jgi:hypothetical protein